MIDCDKKSDYASKIFIRENQNKQNISPLSIEELSFLGDEGVELSKETDLFKIGVRLIPFQKGSPCSGKAISVSLGTLQPWSSLLDPFLHFEPATTGFMLLETNFETLSVLVEFLKAWDTSSEENYGAFTILHRYLNAGALMAQNDEKEKVDYPNEQQNEANAILNNYLNYSKSDKGKEKEKEQSDAFYDQPSPPFFDIRFSHTKITEIDEREQSEGSHPFNKALELYLLANYLNIKEVADFSIKFLHSSEFLESIDNEAYRDLAQRLGGQLEPDEFNFTWNALFIHACQTKKYDDAKALLEFYLKKNELDDLRRWVKKPNLPEEVLPYLIKMVLNVDDKNTPDFDKRFNFAIDLLQDHFSQIFHSYESSLTNTSFFYSLFSIEEAVQTEEQATCLLRFFVANPSEKLRSSPALSLEEKTFLDANGVFVSSFSFRESITSLVLFQKMLHSLTKRDKHGDILPLLKILCSQIQLREKDAAMNGLVGKILLTIRTCFTTLFKQKSSCEQYLKNLELFIETRDRMGEWLPNSTETLKALFDLEALKLTEFNYLQLHTLKNEDILRIIELAKKIKATNPVDLMLLQSILKAICLYQNTKLNGIKSTFANELSALYKLVGILDVPMPQNIFGLIAGGQEREAVQLFNQMGENAMKIFNSGNFETLDIDKIISFAQRLESTIRNRIFSSVSKFLLESKRWDVFLNFHEKTFPFTPMLYREMTFHYLINNLKNYKKTNIELCLKASAFLLNSLKSFRFSNVCGEKSITSQLVSLSKIFMKSKNKNLLEVVKNFSNLTTSGNFRKQHVAKIENSTLAARLLLGEGREVIDGLRGVRAKCSCLDRLGEVVSLIKTSSLPLESVRALLSFAFDSRVLKEVKSNPRESMNKLYPFLLRVCSRLSYVYKIEGQEELHQEMDRYINIILSMNVPHFSRGVQELFMLHGDIDFLLSFKSTINSKEFDILLSKTGKLLAKKKNEQLFYELAEKCSLGDFKILSTAYFSTLRRNSNPEDSQNPTACPSSFFNALLMCHAFPIQGIHARIGKRKRELEVSPMKDEGTEKIREEKGKEKASEEQDLKRPRIEPVVKFGDKG